MLLPVWALFTISVGIGILGAWMTYKRPWAAIFPVLVILILAAVSIVRLRDPSSVAAEYRAAIQDWTYIAMLFWSAVIGLSLPLVGLYLRARFSRNK